MTGLDKSREQKEEILCKSLMMTASQLQNKKFVDVISEKVLAGGLRHKSVISATCGIYEEHTVNKILRSVQSDQLYARNLFTSYNDKKAMLLIGATSNRLQCELDALRFIIKHRNCQHLKQFMVSIDLKNKALITKFVRYRDVESGQSLLHSVLSGFAGDDSYKLLLSFTRYFGELQAEWLAVRDKKGWTALDTFCERGGERERPFILWHSQFLSLSNIGQRPTLIDRIASNRDFLRLVINAIDLNVMMENDRNMELLRNLLDSAIRSTADNAVDAVKQIVNKYYDQSDQIKLLSMASPDTLSNAFHVCLKLDVGRKGPDDAKGRDREYYAKQERKAADDRLQKAKYLLSLIDGGKNNDLLLATQKDGKTPLHFVNNDLRISALIAQQFDGVHYKDILDTLPTAK